MGHPWHPNHHPSSNEQDWRRQYQRRLLCWSVRCGRAEIFCPCTLVLVRCGRSFLAASWHHFLEPGADWDPTGEGEPGQAGEVHDPHWCIQRALSCASSHCHWLLFLRTGSSECVGNDVDTGTMQRLPHTLPLSGHSDKSAGPHPLPDEVPHGSHCWNSFCLLGWKQKDPLRMGQLFSWTQKERCCEREPAGAAGAGLCPVTSEGPKYTHYSKVKRDLDSRDLYTCLVYPAGSYGWSEKQSRQCPQQSEQLPWQLAPVTWWQIHPLQLQRTWGPATPGQLITTNWSL